MEVLFLEAVTHQHSCTVSRVQSNQSSPEGSTTLLCQGTVVEHEIAGCTSETYLIFLFPSNLDFSIATFNPGGSGAGSLLGPTPGFLSVFLMEGVNVGGTLSMRSSLATDVVGRRDGPKLLLSPFTPEGSSSL